MNVTLKEVVDLPNMAVEMVRQHLIEVFDDLDFLELANDDPEALELPDEEWTILLDNLMRVKVDIKVSL
jgi:hypothetical protein